MSGRPLRLRGVSWWFDRGAPVLEDVDLDVAPRECVVVRGANGSGKTTLARIAAGALVARRGTVERDRSVSYVPQASDNPPVRLRTDRFLRSFARMRAIEPSFEAVDALRLRTAMRRPLNELSTGTIVKVLIASAVAGQPGLLICDEPFADLDIDARDTVRGMLARLRANGSGILLTDHSDTSHALADRELRITDGALR